MMVLRRAIGKAIAIGDDIVVTILSVEGHDVRIGVNAPHEMSVCNEEAIVSSHKISSFESERSDCSSRRRNGEESK